MLKKTFLWKISFTYQSTFNSNILYYFTQSYDLIFYFIFIYFFIYFNSRLFFEIKHSVNKSRRKICDSLLALFIKGRDNLFVLDCLIQIVNNNGLMDGRLPNLILQLFLWCMSIGLPISSIANKEKFHQCLWKYSS